MSGTPIDPDSWSIVKNSNGFTFESDQSAVGAASSPAASSQYLNFDEGLSNGTPGLILTDESDGTQEQLRAEFAVQNNDINDQDSAGVVFGYQDNDNYWTAEAVFGADFEVDRLAVNQVSSGTIGTDTADSTNDVGTNSTDHWHKCRIQIYDDLQTGDREVRLEVRENGLSGTFKIVGSVTINSGNVPSPGEVGLACMQEDHQSAVGIDDIEFWWP